MNTSTHKLHTTGQTTRLQKVYNIAYELRVYVVVMALTMLLGVLLLSVVLGGFEQSTTPLQPVLIVTTPTPTSTPVATATTTAGARVQVTTPHLSAAVVAYDAPEGNVLGPIDADRAYTITARYGTDWLQADIDGSGLVWIRSQELGTVTVAGALPDLRPAPTAEVIYMMQAQPGARAREEQHKVILPPAPAAQPTAPLSTVEGPIYEKPTPVLTDAEQYWTWPTAVPLPRTPGVEVSSTAYEACRRSGQAFGDCVHHMPDDYFTLHDQYDH